jgi:hypothetical protein
MLLPNHDLDAIDAQFSAAMTNKERRGALIEAARMYDGGISRETNEFADHYMRNGISANARALVLDITHRNNADVESGLRLLGTLES